MNKRAQILIVSLWILIILTILAVSIGHRVSFALRISRYQRDKLKALYLAKAGINRAIAELNKDTNNYDALNEPWSDNDELFKKIILDDNLTEFATVSYTILDEDKKPKNIYGVTDEERKLNINTANTQQLQQLFILRGFEVDVPGLADTIVNWIDSDEEPEEEKRIFKNKPLETLEELLLILEYFYQQKNEENYQGNAREAYNKIRDLITVYADNTVNINTTSQDVLTILANSVANSDEKNSVAGFVNTIIELRDNQPNKAFESVDITVGGVGSDYQNLLDKLKRSLTVQSSNNFLIEVAGNVSTIKSKLVVVYNRAEKGILYWHEG